MYSRIPSDPATALRSFYERDVAEDQIMDPLILSGDAIVPLLERALVDPDMPRRRYAIGALGNIQSKTAVPVLERMTLDQNEPDYIRCDSLAAIAMIDKSEGLRIASLVMSDREGCLSDTANQLQRDFTEWARSNSLKRTYLDALIGRHG
jgi:HEAT repeat protein